MAVVAYVRNATGPILPPPLAQRGAIGWLRANLFSSWSSTAVTLLLAAFCLWTLPDLIAWATTRAVWRAPDGALCRAHQDGACWAFIAAKLDYFRYGSFPLTERWRVDVFEGVGAVLIAWLLWPRAPRRGVGARLLFVV
jgi:general L-amino acid transport system permease protein